MKYDPQKHHRRSIRLPGYDYSQIGAYFVTMVTRNRACLFGEIVDGEVRFSHFGLIADECWRLIPEHFPHVELGAFMVMPNHVHGIIILHDRDRRDMPWRVPTWRVPTIEKFGKPVSGSLATIIRQYKSSVTRIIGQRYGGISNIWQHNYYEHIIRTGDEHDRIHQYIESNPANWNTDGQNPKNLLSK
jgi:REP element-mobilizing transposase RayT